MVNDPLLTLGVWPGSTFFCKRLPLSFPIPTLVAVVDKLVVLVEVQKMVVNQWLRDSHSSSEFDLRLMHFTEKIWVASWEVHTSKYPQ